MASLSGGQRQTVAIAKAVLGESRVVFLDEPTAALGVAQTRQVLDLVRRLADQGLGVVLISHNMNDVMEVAAAAGCDQLDDLGLVHVGALDRRGQLTEVEHRDPVRHLEYVQHVVRDEDDGRALVSQPPDEIEHLGGLGHAEGGGRLVEDDDL